MAEDRMLLDSASRPVTAADVVDETFCCPLIGMYPCERERRGCYCHELNLINQRARETRAAIAKAASQ